MASSNEDFPRYGYKPNNPQGRGLCCIIANFYSENIKHPDGAILPGYAKDVDRIQKFFGTTLGYTMRPVKQNVTKNAFFKELDEIKQQIMNESKDSVDSGYDKLFVFVLSHGSEEGILMCKDISGKEEECDDSNKPVVVKVETITSFFDHGNIPSLHGYPKCLFVQACRGQDHTFVASPQSESKEYEKFFSKEQQEPDTQFSSPGVSLHAEITNPVNEMSDTDVEDEVNKGVYPCFEVPFTNDTHIPRPSSANMLVVFSCLPSDACFVTQGGSWFVTAVIDTMETHYSSKHLLDIIVEVNRIIHEQKGWSKFAINFTLKGDVTAGIEIEKTIKPFSMYAEKEGEIIGKLFYHTRSLGNIQYGGILTNEKRSIKKDEHLVRCKVKCHPCKTVKPRELKFDEYIAMIKDPHPQSEIFRKWECELLDKTSQDIVGIGTISIKHKSIAYSIKHKTANLSEFTLSGYTEENMSIYPKLSDLGKIDNLEEQKVVIAAASTIESPSEQMKTQITGKVVVTRGLPLIQGDFCQQSIFESTFTKQFYLCGQPEPNQTVYQARIQELETELEKEKSLSQHIATRTKELDLRALQLDERAKKYDDLLLKQNHSQGTELPGGSPQIPIESTRDVEGATGVTSHSTEELHQNKEQIDNKKKKSTRKSRLRQTFSCVGKP